MTTPSHTTPSRPRRRRAVGALAVAALTGAAMITAATASAAPVGGSFLVPQSNYNTLTVPVTITNASDATTVTYAITQDATPPAPGAFGPKPVTYTVAADGLYTLYAWAKNTADEIVPLPTDASDGSAASESFNVDRVAPVVTGAVSHAPPSSLWYRTPINVSWTATDAAPSSTLANLPPTTHLTTDFVGVVNSVSVCDRAGNCGIGTVGQIKMDVTAPNVAPVVTGFLAAGGTRELRPFLTWNAAGDALSGIKKYYLNLRRLPGGGDSGRIYPRAMVGAEFALTPPSIDTRHQYPDNFVEGKYELTIEASDLAGNITATPKISFVYDPDFVPTQGTPGTGPAIRPSTGNTTPGPGGAANPLPVPIVDTARLLSPRRGARLSARPTLKWKASSAATRYRVQIYRLRANGKTQLRVNAYTTRTSFKVPRKVATGSRVVWRIWAYKGKARIGKAPIGVSYFDLLSPKQLRESRVIAPKRTELAVSSAVTLRWKAKPKSRYYRVTVTRGSTKAFTAVVRGKRRAIPATALATAGTYKVKIRPGVRTSRTRFGGTWAETTLRVR